VTATLTRRALLTATILSGVGAAACAPDSPRPTTTTERTGSPTPTNQSRRTLLAYFSRAGENYYNGGRRTLEVGNTEVLARLISDRIDCDIYKINPADPYPSSYDQTVARNVREQRANARPAIADPLPDLSRYDTVLLGSPVWNVGAPMIMSTFVDGVGLAGKTVLPFVTYAVSGMGTVEDDYQAALADADVRAGLAIRGETVTDAAPEVDEWLRASQLTA
jgi:flavodoxin